MEFPSSNLLSTAESAKRIAPDVAAQAASKAASRLIQSPLVAQLTVRAIESALEKTHVALPGSNDRAAVIELRMDSVLSAKAAVDANQPQPASPSVEEHRALDLIKAKVEAGQFSIDYPSIASSLVRH